MHNSSTPIVPWHSAQGTSPIFLRMAWPPISPTLGLLHADLEWPTNLRCLWLVFFLPFFSQDISTGFSESSCKTLSLLSSPFAQFHFKAITRNNHGFIPCKTSSRPKTSCSFSIKSGSQQTKKSKERQSWFCFSIWRQERGKPTIWWSCYLTHFVIWHTILPLFEATKWHLCHCPFLRGFFFVKRV